MLRLWNECECASWLQSLKFTSSGNDLPTTKRPGDLWTGPLLLIQPSFVEQNEAIQLCYHFTSISWNTQDAALAYQDFLPGFADGRQAHARLAAAFRRATVSGDRSGRCAAWANTAPTENRTRFFAGIRIGVPSRMDVTCRAAASQIFQVPTPIKRTGTGPS